LQTGRVGDVENLNNIRLKDYNKFKDIICKSKFPCYNSLIFIVNFLFFGLNPYFLALFWIL